MEEEAGTILWQAVALQPGAADGRGLGKCGDFNGAGIDLINPGLSHNSTCRHGNPPR